MNKNKWKYNLKNYKKKEIKIEENPYINNMLVKAFPSNFENFTLKMDLIIKRKIEIEISIHG